MSTAYLKEGETVDKDEVRLVIEAPITQNRRQGLMDILLYLLVPATFCCALRHFPQDCWLSA